MITGIFGADFTAFKTAVDGATVTLKGFETDSEKVEKSLSRMGDRFSGKKVVQEAELMAKAIDELGGVSVLTAKELEQVGAKADEAAQKLRAVGKDVPENIQKYADAAKDAETNTASWGGVVGRVGTALAALGIAATVEQLVSMGKEIVAEASALEKMHTQTGISVENLQRLQIVGNEVGVSLQTMVSGATRLEAALGSGDKNVAKALQDLNIDLEHFKSLDAAERMALLSDKIRSMEDPLRVAADLAALYGKSWAEQFPVLKKGFDEVGTDVTVMSSRTVEALSAAGDAAGEFWRLVKVNLGEAMADVLTLSTSEWRKLKSEVDHATEAAAKMRPEGLEPVREGLVDVSGAIGLLNEGLDAEKKKIDESVVANKKFSDAWAELNSAGATWQETLEGIDKETKDSIQYYLQAGASQETVATAFGRTAIEVKAVSAAMKEAKEVNDTWRKFEADTHAIALKAYKDEADERKKLTASTNNEVIAGMKDIQKARDETRDLNMKAALSESDYEIVKVWDVNKEKKLAFGGSVQQREEYNKAVDDLSSAQEQAILTKTWRAADEGGKALKKLTDDAKAAKDEIDKTAEAARSLQGGTSLPGSTQVTEAGGQRYLVSPDGHRVPLGPHGELPDNWFDLYTGRSSFPGRAGGGPVDAGSPYLVGERGPELFVPNSSGTVVPGGGSASVVNHIYVNGTAEDVAKKVAAEIMRTVKAGQQLGAWGT